MHQSGYLSWRTCHEKKKYANRGMLDRDPVMEFVLELQRRVPFILRLKRGEAEEVIEEYFRSFEDSFCDTPEEAADTRKKLHAQVERLVGYFFESGYTCVDGAPTPWIYKTGYEEMPSVEGNVSITAIRKDGRTEYVTLDFIHANTYSIRARIEENKPSMHPFVCFPAVAIRDMRAVYSVWYLKGKDDKGDPEKYPAFEAKAGANVVSSDFGGDITLAETCAARSFAVEEKRDCEKCSYARVCKGYRGISEAVAPVSHSEAEDKPIRKLTKEQQAVVDFGDGALCVVAVPGAGKTHVLVSRMQKLIEAGVPAQSILFLTFAKKAAGEISERVAKALGVAEDSPEMPHIQTLNGFGYEVLRSNEQALGRKVVLAGECLKKELIETVLRNEERIQDVSYSMLKGKYGLVNRCCEWIECIHERGEEFFRTYFGNKVDVEGVLKVYRTYSAIFEAKGYVSYDEQINLCVKLLEEHPELAEQYGMLYRYVMVDEFQDVSEPQMRLLQLIAEKSGNIVAVGDDDQAIYGFRGGDSRFMLNFKAYFPTAKTLVMSRNFRSNDKIVELAERVISHNHERIGKHILAGRGASNKPLLVDAPSNDTLFHYVKQMKEAYGGRNIAIIARRNSELYAWQEFLWANDCPCTSPKDYLITDRVFETLYDVFSLYFVGPDRARESFARLYATFEEVPEIEVKAAGGESFYNLLLREGAVSPLENTAEAKVVAKLYEGVGRGFVERVFASYLAIDYAETGEDMLYNLLDIWYPGKRENRNYTLAIEELISVGEESAVTTVDELFHIMRLLVDYQDTKRLTYDYGDAVNLLTAHDSKGKEFDAVLVLNGDSFIADGDEESRRVLYVALTRARHTLVISTTGTETNALIYDEVEDGATKVLD